MTFSGMMVSWTAERQIIWHSVGWWYHGQKKDRSYDIQWDDGIMDRRKAYCMTFNGMMVSWTEERENVWDSALPGHCNIWGNTRADQLAKEGSQLEQLDGGSSYAESKTLVKAAMARKWKSDHPDSDPSDPIHGMTRSQQTIIFRLRTGHNRLRQHMYKRFKVGDSEICPCGQAPQNTEHVL